MTIRRREFITLLGGAGTWPLAAHAQQPATPVVGWLGAGSLETTASSVAAFRVGLAQSGYVEGQNVAIEFRWADGQFNRLPELAAGLVSRRVNVIVAAGSRDAAAAPKHAVAV